MTDRLDFPDQDDDLARTFASRRALVLWRAERDLVAEEIAPTQPRMQELRERLLDTVRGDLDCLAKEFMTAPACLHVDALLDEYEAGR